VQVLRRCPGQALASPDALGRQHEFAGPGDQAYAFQPVLQPRLVAPRPPEDLEAQLRRPGAVRPQRQVFEHHIGRPPVGRSPAGSSLNRFDQRIGRLVGAAAMHTHRDP